MKTQNSGAMEVYLIDVGSALESALMAFDGRRTAGQGIFIFRLGHDGVVFCLDVFGGQGYGTSIDTEDASVTFRARVDEMRWDIEIPDADERKGYVPVYETLTPFYAICCAATTRSRILRTPSQIKALQRCRA